ncbi:major facilitator superfamily domain-containing protein [Limtongia smithiae]|uniref:major facilitator superfamily domain-containing protein n=1 Tax=Limtongia smithiae TaxID=1125753 RepID=UPI0034CE5A5B
MAGNNSSQDDEKASQSSGSSTIAEQTAAAEQNRPIIGKDFGNPSLGTTLSKTIPGGTADVNFPFDTVDVRRAQFPQEYEVETPSGLVPIATLQDDEASSGAMPVMSANGLYRTETAATLETRLSRTATTDVNFPFATERSDQAEFPDEYTAETETGLVPISSIRSFRRIPTRVPTLPSLNEGEEEKGEPEIEFVTFTIGDKANPINWSKGYKWYVTMVVSMLVICVAFGSSCVTGGLGLIEDKYNVSQEVAILTCSIMVIGFAVGPLAWSPLSEQIGRRPVYFISLLLYTIFNIPCALSPNIGGLLVSRFLCGVFSSSGLVLAGGTIADIWPAEHRGNAIAYFAAAPYCGPVFGPLVCGWINIGSGRLDLIFWVNLAFAGAMFVIVATIPETYAPTILKNRAKKLRKETGNPMIMTEQEKLKQPLSEIIRTVLLTPIHLILTEPVLDLMNMYIVLIYSLLYAFFFAYPVIFTELHDYNDGIIGLMFIPILIGAMFALVTTPVLEKMYSKTISMRKAVPEDRLIGAMIGAPFVPVALFILGATSYKKIIWVGPSSAGLAFGYGMVLIYFSVNNYIIDSYERIAASALAAKVFTRSAGGAAFPLFTTQMYHRLGLQWASWLLAFISLAMVLIPFGFYRYGAHLRSIWGNMTAYSVSN